MIFRDIYFRFFSGSLLNPIVFMHEVLYLSYNRAMKMNGLCDLHIFVIPLSSFCL